MADGAKRTGDVAGETADVGALGDGDGEGDEFLPGTGRGTSEAGGGVGRGIGPSTTIFDRGPPPVPGRIVSEWTVTRLDFIAIASPARARA